VVRQAQSGTGGAAGFGGSCFKFALRLVRWCVLCAGVHLRVWGGFAGIVPGGLPRGAVGVDCEVEFDGGDCAEFTQLELHGGLLAGGDSAVEAEDSADGGWILGWIK